MEYTCQNCKKIFTRKKSAAERAQGRFCSHACYLDSKVKGKPVVECENCRKKFYKAPKDIKRTEKNFCSKECFRKWELGTNNPAWKDRIERKCDTCGKSVFLQPSRNRNRKRTFCSDECRRVGMLGDSNPAYTKTEYVCVVCGESYKIPKNKTNRQTYCSKKCADVAHSRRMMGEGNSWHKDGKGNTPYQMGFKSYVH